MDTILNRVAAGLRRMDKKPDALLFLQSEVSQDFTWDEELCCGISVYHSELVSNMRASTMATDAIFVPIFKINHERNRMEVINFNRGFDEG